MDYRTIDDQQQIADAVIFGKLSEAATWKTAQEIDGAAKQFCADVRAYAGDEPDDALAEEIANHADQAVIQGDVVTRLTPKIVADVDVDKVVRQRLRDQREAIEREHLARVTLIDVYTELGDTAAVHQATCELIGYEGAWQAVNDALDRLGADEPDDGPTEPA